MRPYNFRRILFSDRIILLFFLFLFINFISYSTIILYQTTLVPLRIGVLVVLFILLLVNKLRTKTTSVINNKQIALFLFLFSISFIINFLKSDSFFFFSIFFSLLVFSLFVTYLFRNYPIYGNRILLDIIAFSILYIPVLLLLNPGYIRLDIYGSDAIENIGIKSRFLGWASAVLIGIMLYQFSEKRFSWLKAVAVIVLFFFVVISGSRSSLLSICASILLYFVHQKKRAQYLVIAIISVIFLFFIFFPQINKYSGEVSFSKREEAKEIGVSDESYRGDVIADALAMSWENVGNFLFGFGIGNFRKTISEYYLKYKYNELSSHNTYLEVFITSGFLCFVAFFFLYVVKPFRNFYSKKKEFLYIFIPIILISATEDNFGLGQFLFVIFSLLAFSSYKVVKT